MREDLIDDPVNVWSILAEAEIRDIARVGGYDLTKNAESTTNVIEKSIILCLQKLPKGDV